MTEAVMTDEAPADELPITRRKAAEFLAAKGLPISYSTLMKLCSPAINEGPPSCGRWGRDTMYKPSDVLAWARKRMSQRSGDGSGNNPG